MYPHNHLLNILYFLPNLKLLASVKMDYGGLCYNLDIPFTKRFSPIFRRETISFGTIIDCF